MRNDLIVSESIDIHASTAKVWKALTDPEIIKKYLFGTETITDWKVGSDVIFQGAYQEQTYRDKGTVLENIPFEKLSYTYWSSFSGVEDIPENYSVVTYTLQPVDEAVTTFTWTQKGFAGEENYQHSLSGMNEFLGQIKQVIENEAW